METSKKSVEKENNDLVEKLKSSEQQLRNLTEKVIDVPKKFIFSLIIKRKVIDHFEADINYYN